MKTNYDLEDDLHKLRVPLVGIYTKDKFPKVPRRNGAYVINLQDDYDSNGVNLMGTHWTCMYVEGKKAGYFDAFGFPPPRQVQDFLKPFRPYLINDKEIQNKTSGVCGSYCVFFCWWMNKHKELPFNERMKIFVDLFSDDVKKNRGILQKRLTPLKIDLYE
jgi:hypothetical protein